MIYPRISPHYLRFVDDFAGAFGEGFLVSLLAEDLPLADRALCNALVEGPTHELAVARLGVPQLRHSDSRKPWTQIYIYI